MANLRDIRKRIRSVQSTKKITKAMKMVAAAKLRRAQEAAEQSKPYARAITKLLEDLVAEGVGAGNALLTARPVQKRLLVIFSSDRGLCGAFNSGLLRRADRELADPAVATELLLIGKKANSYYARRPVKVWKKADAFWTTFSHEASSTLAHELLNAYLDGTFDRVDLLYNEFVSVMTQTPRLETFAPISPSTATDQPLQRLEGRVPDPASPVGEGRGEPRMIVPAVFEPGKREILEALIPKAVEVRFYQPSLQSQASEFGARMSAMDSATRNAGDMIDDLTLTMNRVRQANITRELVEIISGAEAIN